jgi:hypothetical protein
LARHRALDGAAVRARVLLCVDEPDAPGRHPCQRLHLVLHQGDQRRDDQREVGPHQRGELVAERLARARRHHDQHVAVGQCGVDRLALARPERREAEQLAQRRARLRRPRDRLRRRRAEAGKRDVLDGERGHQMVDRTAAAGTRSWIVDAGR